MLRSRKSQPFAGLLVMGAVLASPAVALTRRVDHVLERLA